MTERQKTRGYLLPLLFAILLGVVGIGFQAGMSVAQAAPPPKKSAAELAIEKAATQKRYVIATFYKSKDDASSKMLKTASAAAQREKDRADFVRIDVANAAHKPIIARYGLEDAPIPMTLVIAPNGAVTAAFPRTMKDTVDLKTAFVSAGMADILKVVQAGKLAVVCLKNAKTTCNAESDATIKTLCADKQLAGITDTLVMDPADPKEVEFYKRCSVKTDNPKAQIMLVAPPGRVLGVFDGDITSDQLMARLTQACGSGGCGPSGCGQ